MIQKLPATWFLPVCVLLIAACVSVYAFTGYRQLPNWDEEASIDIALGIRPAMVVGSNGRPTGALQYDQVIGQTRFTNADYTRHNTAAGVVEAVMHDNSNSVLYYLLLHYWMKLSGLQGFGLRLLSILTALVNLVLVARIMAQRWPGRRYWSLAAVLLVGANPIFFLQAFAIRSYMLCVCMLLLATIQWLRLIDRRGEHTEGAAWYWHALWAVLALFSHYFAIAIILPQYAWLFMVLWRRRSEGFALKNLLPPLLAPAILVVPLLLWYYRARTTGIPNMQLLDRTWHTAVQGGGYEATLSNFVKQLFNTTALMLGFDYQVSLLPKAAWQMLAALVMALLLVMGWRAVPRPANTNTMMATGRNDRRLLNPLLYAWLAAMLIYSLRSFASGHFMIFHRTYLVFLTPFLLMGVAGLVATAAQVRAARIWAYGAMGLLGLVSGVGLVVHTRTWSSGPGTPPVVIDTSRDSSVLHNTWVDLPVLAVQTQPTGRIDSIVYSNWKLAHRFNYYLSHHPLMPQRVDSTLSGSTIILYRGAKPHTVSLAGK